MPSEKTPFFDALHFRFACRNFDPTRKIPAEDFQRILEAGRLSPSSYGFEPWKFLIVQDPEIRRDMLPICWGSQMQLQTASHFLVLLARQPREMSPNSEYLQQTIMRDTKHLPPEVQAGFTAKFGQFLKDDFALAGNERAHFEWACRQCYISLAHMLIAAACLGIDSSPMEGFHKESLETFLAEKGLIDRSVFGVACLAAFGYREAPPPFPKTRRPLEDVVQWVL